MKKRGSGILLHITSLPSPYGIGDFGREAYRFADLLAESNQSFWQILPLNQTSVVYDNSPYSSVSAYAGNTILISPDIMVDDGFLLKSDIENHPSFPMESVDYSAVLKYKKEIFSIAFEKNRSRLAEHHEFNKFCNENLSWLKDYSLFVSIKKHFNSIDWSKWPENLRDRKKKELKQWEEKLQENILREHFLQYLFFKQWHSLKDYCESMGLQIIGDLPIYVNYDSADVWANPEIFKLNNEKKPVYVAGVPPDYFSETGQLWGHPVYDWAVLKKTGYSWWINRIKHNLRSFHMFRLDHFRGFVGYWEIPEGEEFATNGQWQEAPAEDFFNTLLKHFDSLPIIAEDLGVITPDVKDIIRQFGFPGMKVLLFAFGEDLPSNPYAPHNYTKNCVAYTGTHDNNTVKGWFKSETSAEEKKRIIDYIGHEVSEDQIHWELIKLVMSSVANMVIIPMQDIIGLEEDSRTNLPASSNGNWRWRFVPESLSPLITKKLSEMTIIYGRG
ncbi:4-alpha-glucanotransferase [Candidatus Scalindua japonica]|uniref:4-alpha-glucanotransferase n=1 Tax=Candidatus Scalindua japonica TaxID=1284222 RepID=A0A286TXC4_9BACT|nr:4-alpha-glucanotransferase [Candidatus Scalindua japonica]GAX60532.1 4-alpha-glucanotransferase [Candidatus Scalindua japonica]